MFKLLKLYGVSHCSLIFIILICVSCQSATITHFCLTEVWAVSDLPHHQQASHVQDVLNCCQTWASFFVHTFCTHVKSLQENIVRAHSLGFCTSTWKGACLCSLECLPTLTIPTSGGRVMGAPPGICLTLLCGYCLGVVWVTIGWRTSWRVWNSCTCRAAVLAIWIGLAVEYDAACCCCILS